MAEIENTNIDVSPLLAGLNLAASVLSNEMLQQASAGRNSETAWQTLYDLASNADPGEKGTTTAQ